MRQWRVLLLMVLAVSSGMTRCLGQTENLLSNASFEDVADGKPADWYFENWQMGGQPSVDEGDAAEGQRSAAVACGSDEGRGAWRQIVQFQGPGFVYFSAAYRTSFGGPPSSDVRGAVVRFLMFRDAERWDHPSIPWFAAPPSTEWARFTKVLPVSAEITSIGIELFNLSTEGTVRWDDVVLRAATREEAIAAVEDAFGGINRDPQPGETGYAPENGTTAPMNPPTFVWLPIADGESDGMEQVAEYVLQWSTDSAFPEDGTESVTCARSIHVPRHVFRPGKWHWRFGLQAPEPAGMVYSRVRSFEVPEGAPEAPFPDVAEVVRKLSEYRPRDLVPPGALAEFRRRAQGELAPQVEAMRRDAEQYIGQELLPEPPMLPPPGDPNWGPEYTRIFRATRPFNAGIVACAQVYLLTGDERFGQEARRRLMHLMSWDPNGSTSLFHHDEPGTELVRLCPRTYDWIYPLLSEEDKQTCRDVLAVRIPQLYKALRDKPFETRPYESHAMDYYISDLTEACIAMAGELPSADGESDGIEEAFEYVLTQLWSPFYPPYGGPDGGWCEGPNYWQWSTGNFLKSFYLVKLATGCDVFQRPWLSNTPYFKLYCNPPYSKMSPFGDGQSGPAGGGDTMYKLGVVLRDPYALWFADEQGRGPYGIEHFIFPRDGLESRPPSDLPQARLFADIGLACMHSDLANGERNVQFMVRSSPFGAISHAYADQNAFILHAYGEPLAIASGYYPYYAGPHHSQWTWQTKAANSILVNGEGQRIRDWGSRGEITQFATTDYCHYARADAHWAYAGRLKRFDRHALFLRPQSPEEDPVIVLYDDIEAEAPATFQWLLHALDEMSIDSPGQRVAIRRGAARLDVRFMAPAGLTFTRTDQFSVPPEAANMPNQWHLMASTTEESPRQRFLTVLLPHRDGQAPAEVRLREAPGCLAVEIEGPAVRHTLLFRTDAAPGESIDVDGMTTDADVLAVARERDGREKATFSVMWRGGGRGEAVAASE